MFSCRHFNYTAFKFYSFILSIELRYCCRCSFVSRGRKAGCPAPPRTDPDVRFSRIRFLGCTRLRADLHSCPLQDPVAIPRSEVGSYLSSPTCPARVCFAGHVLPSGPFPCGRRLSQPLSIMPDKTPRRHITALRRPTWIMDYPRQQHNGASRVLRRLSSCMPRPEDSGGPPQPCRIGCFCVAFGAR